MADAQYNTSGAVPAARSPNGAERNPGAVSRQNPALRSALWGLRLLDWSQGMKLSQPVVQLAAQATLSMAIASLACSQTLSGDCQDVSVDSAGVVAFKHSRLAAVGVGSPICGVAPFVLVRPPERSSSGASDDILKLTIMADVQPGPRTACRDTKYIGDATESVTCARSVPNTALKLIVKYNAPTTPSLDRQYEERTDALLKYLTDEVLCTAQVDRSRSMTR
jgi:hypothetical protein